MSGEYPEHEKLKAVHDQSQAIGEFMEWLGGKGLSLGAYHKHTEGCKNPDWHKGVNEGKQWIDEDWVTQYRCGAQTDQFVYVGMDIEAKLAEFFEIDRDKLEQEKRAMLQKQRELIGEAG